MADQKDGKTFESLTGGLVDFAAKMEPGTIYRSNDGDYFFLDAQSVPQLAFADETLPPAFRPVSQQLVELFGYGGDILFPIRTLEGAVTEDAVRALVDSERASAENFPIIIRTADL